MQPIKIKQALPIFSGGRQCFPPTLNGMSHCLLIPPVKYFSEIYLDPPTLFSDIISSSRTWLEPCVCMLSRYSCVRLFAILWTAACPVPLSMGILKARILECIATPSFRGPSRPRDRTRVSYVSWSPALAYGLFTTCQPYLPTNPRLTRPTEFWEL